MKLLIDANNLAYRANASTQLSTKSGENVSGIYGTLTMLQSFLKKSGNGWKNHMLIAVQEHLKNRTVEFDDLIMCWDGGKSKFRKVLFPEYKAHRESKRADKTKDEQNQYYQFLDQMEQLHDMLPHFGARSIRIKGWEGDDLIYAVVKEIDKKDVTVIVSTDRDMLQLVDEKTFVWMPYKEVLVTPENFIEVTGVPKKYYLTYRILVGDKSDNIDGVYGIGDKKAKDLIIKFGDIKGMVANPQILMKSVVTARILDNPLLLKRNEDLMDMRKIPLTGDTVKVWNNPEDPGNWVEGIGSQVKDALNEEVKFERDIVKTFLMSKQFISILKDFTVWTNVFANLK